MQPKMENKCHLEYEFYPQMENGNMGPSFFLKLTLLKLGVHDMTLLNILLKEKESQINLTPLNVPTISIGS